MESELQSKGIRGGGYSFPSCGRILLDPDPLGTTGGVPVVEQNLESDVPPVNGGPDRGDLSNATVDDTSTDPTAVAALTPADPNQAAALTPAAPQWTSIREAAAAQGFQFDGSVTDDRSALNFLLRQAAQSRQSDIHAQLGRQLAPHASGIQQYLQAQRTPAAPTRQPWEAPEFDPRWGNLVDRDQNTGLFYGKPGVPQDIVAKVNEYADWKTKFDQNPGQMITQAATAQAKVIAAETFREQFAAHQREATIHQIVTENSQWLYQVGPDGQRARDYNNQFIPSPLGARYISQLNAVRNMGVVDPRQQDQLAKQLVRGEYALAAQQAAAAASAQAGNPQTVAAVANPNVNPLQALPPNQRRRTAAATEPDGGDLSLAEQIRRELAAEGVTNDDIERSIGSN